MPNHWDATPRDFIEGRDEMIVNNHAQYCSVVKTGIGKAKMIIGGEVDAGEYYSWNAVEKLLKLNKSGTVNQRTKMIRPIG